MSFPSTNNGGGGGGAPSSGPSFLDTVTSNNQTEHPPPFSQFLAAAQQQQQQQGGQGGVPFQFQYFNQQSQPISPATLPQQFHPQHLQQQQQQQQQQPQQQQFGAQTSQQYPGTFPNAPSSMKIESDPVAASNIRGLQQQQTQFQQQQQQHQQQQQQQQQSHQLPAAAAPPSEHALVLQGMISALAESDSCLLSLYELQRQTAAQPSPESCALVERTTAKTHEELQATMRNLTVLYDSYYLDPQQLGMWLHIFDRITIQRNKVELVYNELQYVLRCLKPESAAGSEMRPLAMLSITKQPFPKVLPQNEQIEGESLQLSLLLSPSVRLVEAGKVQAAMLLETTLQGKGADQKLLEHHEQALDTESLSVQFPLTFLKGTRKSRAVLKFGVVVNTKFGNQNIPATVESEASRPLIVMTNQKQWEACAGTVLRKEAFREHLEISWQRYANALQAMFLSATRQDLNHPTRPLTTLDLAYFNLRYFDGQRVIQNGSFDMFWKWFGRCLQVLRYQRHIQSLWAAGLIYGFVSRDQVIEALRGKPAGTFLIRFSENHSGQFGISYVADGAKVKHYLVQPNDIAAAKITICDFLRDKGQFAMVLQGVPDIKTGGLQTRIVPKDSAFSSYYSSRDISLEGTGYEPL
eukprot:TRINITY_DN870_c3_g1_i1.p1 TRINITY_DN870_c3_g1~~TRINITY_DN870_c3_g1_i1.p1  ORF type:complete len:636 (-),score=147.18 TRINITY_DN870_c3_g1_i1:39-1946(-)